MICNRCQRDLVWHEGAMSGWVHSNNMEENQRLHNDCILRPPAPVSVFNFKDMLEAWEYFDSLGGYELEDIKIGGAFGGCEPTEDDPPVFYVED